MSLEPPRQDKRRRSRGVPPPADFDFNALPDSARLSARDIAALERKAVATIDSWRLIPGHPLRFAVENGHVHYTAGWLRSYRANKGTTRGPAGRPRKASVNQEISA